MCRWFAYISQAEPCLLEDVLLEPNHCIAKQVHEHYLPKLTAHSKDIHESAKEAERIAKENEIRNLLFNADGFGVGWYTGTREMFEQCAGERPIVYHVLSQPLTDHVFKSIAANTAATTLFAHVRAASESSAITTFNCHPFQFGRYLFMHNGGIGAFSQIRRGMLNEMSQYAVENIKGTTDSEHLANLTFTYLAQHVDKHGSGLLEEVYELRHVKAALEQAITKVIELQKKYLESLSAENKTVPPFQPSSLNIAITDGNQLFACRFRNHPEENPPSQYYSTTAGARFNRRFVDDPDAPAEKGLKAQHEHASHFIISSEPITKDEADQKMWHEVEKNYCIMVDKEMHWEKLPMEVKF